MNDPKSSSGPARSGASILLVEDSELIAVALAERLRKAGYSVDVRKNSREVISYVELNKPDLILMDIELSGSRQNGIETIKTLRKKYRIPALYLTALDEDKFFEQAMETDPFAYISKSCDWITLKNQIEMALYRDRIERERIRLAEERNMLLSILETNIDEIYLFDFKTLKIRYANHGASSKTGYDSDILSEKTINDIQPALDGNAVLEKMQELIRCGENALHFAGVHRRADGKTYPVECRLRLVEQGKTYSMLLVAFDLTENSKTTAIVKEIERKDTEERCAANKENNACSVKKYFFENVSHSFRTPLNAVLGYSEILRQKLGDSDPEANSFLDGIMEGGKNLLNLVDNIIDVSGAHCDNFTEIKVPELTTQDQEKRPDEPAVVYSFDPTEVLVVDDSELNRKIIAAMLMRAGLIPITASGGEEALRQAERRSPAAIILDMNMPGISGLETTRALKSSPAMLRIPVIVLSGMKSGADIEALDRIAESRLVKPVSFEKLTSELAKYIKHSTKEKSVDLQAELPTAPAEELSAIRERFADRARELTQGLSMDAAKELAFAITEFSRSINSPTGESYGEKLAKAVDFYDFDEAFKMLETLSTL